MCMFSVYYEEKMADNLTKQMEEVEALNAIYNDVWTIESKATRSYSMKIKEGDKEVLFFITMPPTYPELGPPKYELSAPWLGRKAKAKLLHELDTISIENIGEVSIYLLIEHIRGFVRKLPPSDSIRIKITKKTPCLEKLNCPDITHGDVIVDRKSVFQGHAAEVHSLDDVKSVLAKLKENKKISNAKHNMYAYRIKQSTAKGTAVVVQDFDEDGEAHAGSRLMHLMKVMDLDNTLVIVTRWYGGIQLGPDRFRHISNAARQAIEQAGLAKKKKKK